ncbi:MAG: hypothetical protein WBX01_12285 [Nitrososphaeraceae archaeon]
MSTYVIPIISTLALAILLSTVFFLQPNSDSFATVVLPEDNVDSKIQNPNIQRSGERTTSQDDNSSFSLGGVGEITIP